ncbi:MAG: putative tRNA threonylcarbamoyladenosine biosynthesis protein Gcp [Candidatus Magasanikbacteria bacterium GW2011_GWC2_37_14]|uniref:tRNA N6-adenosine threonylcarbamoyltransferase n=1 Tax=Candidatus Magasanikbacteria bacterium GW2011_GWC2_37_14 TaxID=1619046 RepID=A0A0G0GB69_9BACT|nr:MAG: putative tRNA threonylcarbamoyladenosine biosynthesis protein Gcp [Candidatus Magasanikbacteria bacterium GW2011_GWC2_37_14]
MKILAIESSCDDTSVALVEATAYHFKILAEKTASQIEIHKKYGGVVPEIAGRMHAEKIVPLIEEVLSLSARERVERVGAKTSATPPRPLLVRGGHHKPDVIAVTSGPGLITGLMVGVEAAKALSYLWNIPLIGVNHIEGHIHSVEIPNDKLQITKIKYPALALIASGGHTELIYIKEQPARHASAGVAGGGKYKKIGVTLDDAAGECFDKAAKILGLPYPGGPKISKLAETGNTKAIKFPRPMLDRDNFNFSFAGLKTSALYWLRDNKLSNCHPEFISGSQGMLKRVQHDSGVTINDFCASFEQAIIDVLVGKTLKAIKKYQPKTVILGGGVAANKKLRETLEKTVKNQNPTSYVLCPMPSYAMDNAVMIAIAGYYQAKNKKFTPWSKLVANPNWEI